MQEPVSVRYGPDQGEIVGYPDDETVSVLLLGESKPIELDADDPKLRML